MIKRILHQSTTTFGLCSWQCIHCVGAALRGSPRFHTTKQAGCRQGEDDKSDTCRLGDSVKRTVEKKVTKTGISHTLSLTRLCVCRLMSKLAQQVLGLWSRCTRTCRICAESRLILTGMHEKKFSQLAIFVTVAIFVTSLMKTMHLNWSM